MRKRRNLSRLTLCVVIALPPLASRFASAQEHAQHGSHRQTISSNHLRIEVDGSKNPEQVSDYMAYRQFILAAAVRDNSSDMDRTHRLGVIRSIGLSAEDDAALKAALRSVGERLDEVAAEKQGLSATSLASEWIALRQREGAIVDAANRRVRAFLSKDGWVRLDQFVRERIKPRVKIYRGASR